MEVGNLYIIGLMGSGKTSIGKILSKMLNRRFFDIDEEIIEDTRLSIAQLFDDHGEKYFRQIESNMLETKSKLNNCVISTGGGVILEQRNINIMKNTGKIIHLDISVRNQLFRVKNKKNRPLLNVDDVKSKLIEMKKLRDEIYTDISDYSISTDNRNKKSKPFCWRISKRF